jgi:hypothetical protein
MTSGRYLPNEMEVHRPLNRAQILTFLYVTVVKALTRRLFLLNWEIRGLRVVGWLYTFSCENGDILGVVETGLGALSPGPIG